MVFPLRCACHHDPITSRYCDMPKGPPSGIPPLWFAGQRDALTLRYGDAMRAPFCIPPLWCAWHNGRLLHRRGDVPWAYPRCYAPFGVHAITFPALDLLPGGTGDFLPNIPAAACVAMPCNAATLAFAASFRFTAMVIYLGCIPVGMPIAVCMPSRCPHPCYCDMPRGSPSCTPPL